MAKLNITWTSLADFRVTTGAGGGESQDLSTARGMLRPSDQQTEKPFVVYLTSSDEKDQTSQDVIEQTTLKDERVSIASKLFTMIKDDGEMITRDHPYARWVYGRELPRFVAFCSNGDPVGKLEGRASPSKLYGLMKKTASRDYIINVDRMVKDYQKILTSLDKLSVLQSALDQKESGDNTSAEKRKIEKERDELAKEEEELRQLEEKLLTFKRRNAS
jgi:hypothetical protein